MEKLRNTLFDNVKLNWFGNEQEDETEETSDENTETEENVEKDAEKKDPEVDELSVEGLSEAELKTLVKKLDENNKKLSKLARERLHEVMEKKAKLRDTEKRETESQRKALEEKEQYKTLYNDLKPKHEVLENDVVKTHEFFQTELQEQLADLPEEYKTLVPKGDVREQIIWIKNFKKSVLSKQQKKEEKIENEEEDVKKDTTKKGGVGNSGTPSGKEKNTSEDDVRQQIDNCKTPEELERLLGGYKAAGRK